MVFLPPPLSLSLSQRITIFVRQIWLRFSNYFWLLSFWTDVLMFPSIAICGDASTPHFEWVKVLTVINHVFSIINLFFANHLDHFYHSAVGYSSIDSTCIKGLNIVLYRNSPLRRRRFPTTVNTAGRCRVNRHPGARLFADLLARHIDDDETKHTGAVCRRSFQRESSACEASRRACTVHARCMHEKRQLLRGTYLPLLVHPSVCSFELAFSDARRALRSYANAYGISWRDIVFVVDPSWPPPENGSWSESAGDDARIFSSLTDRFVTSNKCIGNERFCCSKRRNFYEQCHLRFSEEGYDSPVHEFDYWFLLNACLPLFPSSGTYISKEIWQAFLSTTFSSFAFSQKRPTHVSENHLYRYHEMQNGNSYKLSFFVIYFPTFD